MGRGRAKAKQTKVARELKYRSLETDFTSLERELRGGDEVEVPAAYVELAQEYTAGDLPSSPGDGYEPLRRSG